MPKKFLTDLTATGRTITAGTFSGSGASLTNIPNAALTNSSITIGSTSISLGASAATNLAGVTINSTTIPSTATLARTDTGQTFSGTQIFSNTISGSVSGSAASLSSSNSINGVSFPGNSAVKVPPAYSYTTTGGGTLTTGWIIALSGASAPTARPDGTSIAAGDLWISY